MTERRRAPRVEPPKPLAARLKTALTARVVDMSARGVQLEVTTTLRPEIPCDLRFALENGEVVAHGVVRRCRAWGFGLDENDHKALLYRAGVEFLESPPEPLAAMIGALLGKGRGTEGAAAARQVPDGEGAVQVRGGGAGVGANRRPPRERH